MTLVSDLIRREGAPLVRFNPDGRPAPETLIYAGPGAMWWEDHPGALKIRLKVAVKKGQVVVLHRQRRLAVTKKHLPIDGVLVRQLKPPFPRWAKRTLIAAAASTAVSIPAILLYILIHAIWEARTTLVTLLAVVVLAYLVIKGLLGHSATCPGLHCSGCKG